MNLPTGPGNAPEYSVSDLAGALKRALEAQFGYVRLRGEISGYRGPHGSGHAYFSLKDQSACIDAVVWKTAFARLRIKPQDGLEVIATGKITTFAGKSKYQIIVETLAPAGIGALMALLEERRRKLAGEGLFEAARKRPLPYLPRVIGVVTSPTGAVIRDVLHRLAERFPRPVLVWPVRVQGETAAEEVAAAIRGFNALREGGLIPRPCVLIVARGGGSLEDLWAFNEEAVVRAAAGSAIPVISAVGHETDTTLIDHAADFRAPTPTAAAEKAVPVRTELVTCVRTFGARQADAALRGVERRQAELRSAVRALPTRDGLFAAKRQRLDLAGAKLQPALARMVHDRSAGLAHWAGRLSRQSPSAKLAGMRARFEAARGRPAQELRRSLASRQDRLQTIGRRLVAARDAALRAELVRTEQSRALVRRASERLETALRRDLERRAARLAALGQLFGSVNYKAVLKRGFVLVQDGRGRPLRSAAAIVPGQTLALEFADGSARAVAEGTPRPVRRGPSLVPLNQGTLFDA